MVRCRTGWGDVNQALAAGPDVRKAFAVSAQPLPGLKLSATPLLQ